MSANLRKLKHLLANLPDDNNVYLMCQRSAPDQLTGAYLVVDQARLFRNLPDLRWHYRVHEQIFVGLKERGAKEVRTDIIIEHLGYQDPDTRRHKRERNLRLLHMDLADNPCDGFIYFNLANATVDAGRAKESCLHSAHARTCAERGVVPVQDVFPFGRHLPSLGS